MGSEVYNYDSEDSAFADKQSELKSTIDAQLKVELPKKVKEIDTDDFVRNFLYPSSNSTLELERDKSIAAECLQALKLKDGEQHPAYTSYSDSSGFSRLWKACTEDKTYKPLRQLLSFAGEYFRDAFEQEERGSADKHWHAPVDPKLRPTSTDLSSLKCNCRNLPQEPEVATPQLEASAIPSSSTITEEPPLRRDFVITHDKPLWWSERLSDIKSSLAPDLNLILRKPEDAAIVDPGRCYWKDVKVPIEAKGLFVSVSTNASFCQSARYARAVLTEQYDRSFVFTVLVNAHKCRVFRWDVVGAEVTHEIDIHQNPALFIQIMGRFATMTPAELGYDVHFSNAGRVLASHQERLSFKQHLDNKGRLAKQHAAFLEDKLCTTLTIHPSEIREYFDDDHPHIPNAPDLVLNLTSFICDTTGLLFHRYTRVWRGQVVEDLVEWKTGPTYVVKQNWAEASRPNEGYFYKVTEGVSAMPTLVCMEECERTSDARQGLGSEFQYPLKSTERPSKSTSSRDFTPSDRSSSDVTSGLQDSASAGIDESPQPLVRILIRLVFLEEYRRLEYATDSIEILDAAAQWVQGLIDIKELGIVHRDISYNNLMLPAVPDEGSESEDDEQRPRVAKVIDLGLAHREVLSATDALGVNLSDAGFGPGSPSGSEVAGPPRQPRPHHHLTGTLPFIALEIVEDMTNKRIPALRAVLPVHLKHDLHHDVESVFWVILYHCLQQTGDNGNRRMVETLQGLRSRDISIVATFKSHWLRAPTFQYDAIEGLFPSLRFFLKDFADHYQMSYLKKERINPSRVLRMIREHHARLVEQDNLPKPHQPLQRPAEPRTPPRRSELTASPKRPLDATQEDEDEEEHDIDTASRDLPGPSTKRSRLASQS